MASKFYESGKNIYILPKHGSKALKRLNVYRPRGIYKFDKDKTE